MKLKALLIALAAIMMAFTCNARDQYSHDPAVLPQAARTIIDTHFPKLQISHIKIDKHTFEADTYDVVLTDGTEIEFDSKGKLEEIDCGRMGRVPSALIAKPIVDYVSRTYPAAHIIKYDVKRHGYEVELNTGLELVFNQSGAFLRIDD